MGTLLTALRSKIVLLLFFLSGFAALIYEVLWMKELSLLFGNTAQASATTLTVFFLGLVAGSRFWGGRAAGAKEALKRYAALEIGVALSALLYFVLLDAYHFVYAPLFQALGNQWVLFLLVKFLLAMLALFPAAFFMGGTFPLISHYLVESPDELGRTTTMLYAVNTAGAAVGAYLAGFYLPASLGFKWSYASAIGVNTVVAMLAWGLAAAPAGPGGKPVATAGPTPAVTVSAKELKFLAFFSGFAVLSLEVLWTRMFAQVLQNSVYTFSAILVTFLLAIALAGGLANYLISRKYETVLTLAGLLTLSALLVGATPFAFNWWTGGMEFLSGHVGPGRHGAFWATVGLMLGPVLVIGAVFPYLLGLAKPLGRTVGRTVGDLAAVNTIGGAGGALAAGFLMLDLFGLWRSIRLVGVAYACAALIIAWRARPEARFSRAAPIGVLLLLVSILDPSKIPVVRVDPVGQGESLLEVWEGSAAIVAVVRRQEGLSIKMDNSYLLGGTGAALSESRQTHLPMLLASDPRAVFFLGMGTGLSAGAVLAHPVERVVVTELSRDVIRAARRHFRPYLNGLFEDPRVRVVNEDGRNYLLGTDEKFDVIIADLFLPWKAGVGNLFAREHYEAALGRLEEGGLYAQWLPLFQLSRFEFGVIARTMTDVFPQVTLWRGTIQAGFETAMLVGHKNPLPLDINAVGRRLLQAQPAVSGDVTLGTTSSTGQEDGSRAADVSEFLLRYCGNMTVARSLFTGYPVNVDDLPVIEYRAPLTHFASTAQAPMWLVGPQFLSLLAEVSEASPARTDPYLRAMTSQGFDPLRAGLRLHTARLLAAAQGDDEGARKTLEQFARRYGLLEPKDVGDNGADIRELNRLIETYEERIRALRRLVEEAQGDTGAAARP